MSNAATRRTVFLAEPTGSYVQLEKIDEIAFDRGEGGGALMAARGQIGWKPNTKMSFKLTFKAFSVGGKYEFPYAKYHANEQPIQALVFDGGTQTEGEAKVVGFSDSDSSGEGLSADVTIEVRYTEPTEAPSL